MLLESDGDGYLPSRIPDTLQALIAARIDQLPTAEKALLHRASVIGRIFWHGAIASIARPTSTSTCCSTTSCCATSSSPSRARRSSASGPSASSTC